MIDQIKQALDQATPGPWEFRRKNWTPGAVRNANTTSWRRKKKVPNEKGWYTKEEVLETGLPYYIPASNRWTATPYEFAVLLSKSRCKQLGMPILCKMGYEAPSAFRYASAAGTGTDDKKHRYIPLYDRTDVFEAGELDMRILFKGEVMGTKEDKV